MRVLIWISFGLEFLALTWIFYWNLSVLKSWSLLVICTELWDDSAEAGPGDPVWSFPAWPILGVWNASAAHRSELNSRFLYLWRCLCKKVPLLRKGLSKGQGSTHVSSQPLAPTLGVNAFACGRIPHSVCQQKCCDQMKLSALGCELSRTCLNSTVLCGLLYYSEKKKISRGTYFIVNEIRTAFCLTLKNLKWQWKGQKNYC